jgi:hypothetical protein
MTQTKLQPLNIQPETRLKLGMQSTAEETDQVVIEVSGSAAFLQQALPPLVEAVRKFANVTNAQAVIDELVDANAAVRQGFGYDGLIVQITRR